MSHRVTRKYCFAIFKVKVTRWVHIINIWSFRHCLEKYGNYCNQTRFDGTSPQGNQTRFDGTSPQGNQTRFDGTSPQVNQTRFDGTSPQVNQTRFDGTSPQGGAFCEKWPDCCVQGRGLNATSKLRWDVVFITDVIATRLGGLMHTDLLFSSLMLLQAR